MLFGRTSVVLREGEHRVVSICCSDVRVLHKEKESTELYLYVVLTYECCTKGRRAQSCIYMLFGRTSVALREGEHRIVSICCSDVRVLH